MEKIAIIGMGISGMGVAAAYEKEVKPGTVKIDCYDNEESFGRGFPFRQDSDEILINIKTDMISYDYENLDDFKDWLKEEGYSIKEYMPRYIFGLYTQDRLKKTMKKLNANKFNLLIKDLDWIAEYNKWKLETSTEDIKYYDRVHLCCGDLPQIDPFNLEENARYIDPIYPSYEKLNPIVQKDSVSVIGTSLSAVDISRYLLVKKDIKRIHMFSRSNIIPTLRLNRVDLDVKFIRYDKCLEIIKNSGNGLMSFDKFEDLLNEELEYHGLSYESLMDKYTPGIKGLRKSLNQPKDLAIIQTLLSHLTPTFNRIWTAFTDEARNRFSEKYDDFIQAFGNPLPIPTGKILINAADSNRLTVLQDVTNIEYNDKDEVFYLLSDSSVLAKVDWICNATGLDTSLKTLSRSDSLVGKMINKRYLQVDDYGGITVLPDKITAFSPRLGEFPSLHGHGVLISGVQLRNNSTSVIQRTAHDLIKNLY